MNDLVISFLNEEKINYVENCSLKDRTSFKVGGSARLVIEPGSEEEILKTAGFLSQHEIEYIVLGKGSNMLFPDEAFKKPVISLTPAFGGMELVGEDVIYAQSGAALAKVCQFAMENSLTGMEFAYGIPGSMGGAVYMNAGAYGGELKDIIVKIRYLEALNIAEINGSDAGFAYRKSIFTDKKTIILGAFIKLKKGNKEDIKAKMEDILNRRKTKQPLEYPSAGSTFKRPKGDYASRLIDECGLKGICVGGAQVSEKHAGFVINRNGASAQDIIELIELVKREVYSKTGYKLEEEVKIIS